MTVSAAWAVESSPLKAESFTVVAQCLQKKDVPSTFYEVDLNLGKTLAIEYLEI